MCKTLQASVIYNRKKDSVFSLIISLFLAVTCIKASMQLMFAGEMLWNIVWSIIILATIAICFSWSSIKGRWYLEKRPCIPALEFFICQEFSVARNLPGLLLFRSDR